jgi:hypothetical protein
VSDQLPLEPWARITRALLLAWPLLALADLVTIVQYEQDVTYRGLTFNGMLVVAIPYLVWAYRAYENERRIVGLPELKRGSAWVVVSTFVPLANLYVPFDAVSEVAARVGARARTLGWWWVCTAIGNFPFSTDGPVGDWLFATRAVFLGIGALLLRPVVAEITARQRERVAVGG